MASESKHGVLHCSKCGVTAQAQCGCNAAYIPAGEAAAAAVKAHPEKSNRAIAEEIGVNYETVRRARKSTDADASVGKRTGRDGKARRMPSPKLDKARAAVRADVEQGKTVSRKKVAKELGIGEGEVQRAVLSERARLEALADPEIDPATLSKSAQAKLASAMRQAEKKLRIEIEQRVRDEIRAMWNETLMPAYKREEALYRRVLASRKGVLTRAVFRRIRAALHPDSRGSVSDESLTELRETWESLEAVLVSEKEMPTNFVNVPSDIDELRGMQRKAA